MQKNKTPYLLLIIAILGFNIVANKAIDVVACIPYFSPEDDCTKAIVERIKNAKYSIFVQSYSFTSVAIAGALIEAFKRGVKVILIVDNSQKDKTLILKMAQIFPVFVDKVPGIAHNKVIIIDDEIVLTGSFNFTHAAQHRNVENSVHLISKSIAKKYKKHWKNRFEVSERLYA